MQARTLVSLPSSSTSPALHYLPILLLNAFPKLTELIHLAFEIPHQGARQTAARSLVRATLLELFTFLLKMLYAALHATCDVVSFVDVVVHLLTALL